jgi:hypothetical protein
MQNYSLHTASLANNNARADQHSGKAVNLGGAGDAHCVLLAHLAHLLHHLRLRRLDNVLHLAVRARLTARRNGKNGNGNGSGGSDGSDGWSTATVEAGVVCKAPRSAPVFSCDCFCLFLVLIEFYEIKFGEIWFAYSSTTRLPGKYVFLSGHCDPFFYAICALSV